MCNKIEIKNTASFQVALQRGEIENAKTWLKHVKKNRYLFPQYDSTWKNWVRDRQEELVIYQQFKEDGTLDKHVFRSKVEAQIELESRFGLRNTSDFQLALKNRKVALAEEWLNYICKNKLSFPQYLAPWNRWLRDRQEDLAEAKVQP